jgi:hypothetical protein
MRPARRTPLLALLLAVFALLAASCAVDVSDITRVPDAAVSETSRADALAALDETACPSGLTADGASLFADRVAATGTAVPTYELDATIDPEAGTVDGTLIATIPTDDDQMRFRVFAGMDAFNSGLAISNVTVDGEPTGYDLDRSLLTVANPAGAGATATVSIDFDFTIDQMAANENLLGALTGDTLQPDQVGLLGRTESGMQLGHWFPVFMPNGTRTDPDPSGFGDIGAFAAAAICADVTVPDGYTVITSGARFDEGASVTESATGIRDFAMLISNDIELLKGTVEGVEVRVWGPSGDRESLQTVLDYSLESQQALHDAFGPYPWTEIDVVSAPLGGGVGGMEWPGMVWIERSLFAGGIPGMGQLDGLGDLFGATGLGENDLFEDLLGSLGGDALDSTLEWTVAHELGHEWFHALVGNDSIASPAVDEPLAQFAACVAMQRIHPDNWRDICDTQTTDQFAQARALGVDDAPADQASDEFDSALQYGAVVYGKAPGFYFEAAEVMGWDPLVDALASFVEANAFSLVGTDVLRNHLVEAAGDDGATIDALWERWFSEAKGDEDIEPADLFGGIDLGGDLFGENGPSFEDLFGTGDPLDPGIFGEDGELDLDDFLNEFLGPDSPLGEGMLDENGEPNLDEFFGEDSPFGDGSIFEYLDDGELSEDELNQLLEDLLGG